MVMHIAEILNAAEKAETKEQKINILRKNGSQPLLHVLYHVYSKNVKFRSFNIPAHNKNYLEFGMCSDNLIRAGRKFYLFLDTPKNKLSEQKMSNILREMLENLHRDESLIFEKMLTERRLPYTTIDETLIREAFPKLLEPLEVVQVEQPKPVVVEAPEAPKKRRPGRPKKIR